MKDQYFGDINDYRKYGLLRAISRTSQSRMLVGWMLTHDDGSTDGNFVDYLDQPNRWRHHDPDLYDGLLSLVSRHPRRQVGLIETSGLLPGASFYSSHVPDNAALRDSWFQALTAQSAHTELVFLDPDNGLEVRSKPYGTKQSSKYLFWREVDGLWQLGKSLVIYQHFIREKRDEFRSRMLGALAKRAVGSVVSAFSTPHVLFLLAFQPSHRGLLDPLIKVLDEEWEGQISAAPGY